MQERNKITIAGVLGSGKSTTAKLVAEKLGFTHYSGGDFMRAMAKERNISLLELSTLGETDANVDRAIDETQKKFMDTNDRWVIDSRLGWFLAPDSFKVFLSLDPDIASRRVFTDWQDNKINRGTDALHVPQTIEEVKEGLEVRAKSEQERYKKYYSIDNYRDPQHFDLIVDTGANPPESVARIVIDGYQKWQKQQ